MSDLAVAVYVINYEDVSVVVGPFNSMDEASLFCVERNKKRRNKRRDWWEPWLLTPKEDYE